MRARARGASDKLVCVASLPMRPGLRPFIRVAAEPIARMGGGAAALCRRPWASSLRSTGENYLHRNALPLRPKRSLVIGVENEAAARIDRIGAEDALVVLACKRARLAAFSFDETDNDGFYIRGGVTLQEGGL